MFEHPERIRGRAIATGVAAAATFAVLLGASADRAMADVGAQVDAAGVLQITGDAAANKLSLAASPTQLVVDVGDDGTVDFSFDRSTFTAVEVRGRGGDDEVRVSTSVTDPVTLRGGAGNDTLIGGSGDDTILGGSGDDFADGNRG